jgi:methylglutaconyl-CoA hydratase
MGGKSTIRTLAEGPLLRVTLERPEIRNAFDDRMIAELTQVLRKAASRSELRCLLLEGAGPVFCAGADLNWMQRAAGWSREENLADARRMADLFLALQALPFPSVARIRGAALGGATGLAACTDVAIAASNTRFGFTEVRIGIVPAVISGFVLRKVPRVHALRYFQSGEIFDGTRAAGIGLISEAVPAEELDAHVDRVVESLLAVAPRAVRAAKGLVDLVAGTPFPDVLEVTAALIADLRATPEAREGMQAFLEKRRPAWQGGLP